jgi:radical SAM/Cys-rich protein
MATDFETAVEAAGMRPLTLTSLETLQVNLGNRCNQRCTHCHVEAGPDGENLMTTAVMNDIISFLQGYSKVESVDLTGGCPEMHLEFRNFVEQLVNIVSRIMVRSNLTVLLEKSMDSLPEFYKKNKLVVIASLPCYTAENVTRQRGAGVFAKSIAALKILNSIGYGSRPDLELHLVYNPGSAVLPGPQTQLEAAYKEHLLKEHGIIFNKLFTITNAPIGRFRNYLQSNGTLPAYMAMLRDSFNPQTLDNVMCRNLLSVDFQGLVYNCDFNQALRIPLRDGIGWPLYISKLNEALAVNVEILTGEHCFSCTAGAGSSCTGELAKAC